MIHLIAGPTASGKSAMAMDLALEIGGEIINADSMQLYADLRILTARPTAEDEAAVPHHLFGVADAAEAWSVGRWLRQTLITLEQIAARGRPAIIVGGAGLYFRALTCGLADVPPVPAGVSGQSLAALILDGEAQFRLDLAARDPAAERRIAVGDRQRLVRAHAVHAATGRALTDWQTDTRPALAAGSWQAQVLDPDRETLFARCDARLEVMLAGGALQEVAALVARELPATLPVMKTLGLRPLAAHLAGETALDDALAEAQRETRRYAKRQLTWFRNQTPDWPKIPV